MGLPDGTVKTGIALPGKKGPTVALHARRGRGGNQGGRGRGVRPGAAGAPDATVKTITQVMVGWGPLGRGVPGPQLGLRIPNSTVKIVTTVTNIMVMALGPNATVKTGTTVPSMGVGGPKVRTTVPGVVGTRVLPAQPSYSALGGRGGERPEGSGL